MIRSAQRGTSMVATSGGVLVFLLLLLAAVQTLFGLYATTLVTSAAHDAAREVAGLDAAADRCEATSDAERRLRTRLGAYSDRALLVLEWTCADPQVVTLRVRATHPSVLPSPVAGLSPLAELDRTISVRVEQPR